MSSSGAVRVSKSPALRVQSEAQRPISINTSRHKIRSFTNLPSSSPLIMLPMHLNMSLPLLLALRLSHLNHLLPALHGSLPSQLYSLLPLPLFLLSSLLPPLLSLPLLPLLPLVSSAALPLVELLLLAFVAGFAANTRPVPVALATTAAAIAAQPYLNNDLVQQFQPHLASLVSALAATVVASRSRTLAELRAAYSSPRVSSKKKPAARRKKGSSSHTSTPRSSLLRSLFSLPPFLLSSLLLLLTYLLCQHVVSPAGRHLGQRLHPRHLPPDYSILAQARGPTGLISVVSLSGQYTLLTADMSVLGGRHNRQSYAPDSVFAQFHVHEAVRLARRPGEAVGERKGGENGRALCIGLGVGVVADALHRLGCEVDAVEIDPVVVKFARRYFGMSAPNVYVKDAGAFLEGARGKGKKYDYVIHDVFTGGAVPADLFAMATWRAVRDVLNDDGVVAVNFVGALDEPPNTQATAAVALVYDRLEKMFGHVRVFSDGHGTRTHNLVFFASPVAERVMFREYAEEDLMKSGVRKNALDEFQKHEVPREKLGKGVEDVEGSDWVLHMGQWDTCKAHLELMKSIHPKELWPALFVKEQLG